MSNPSLPATLPSFEALKRRNDHGAEYWSARDLQPLLGYSQWRRFEEAVGRAQTACEQSGNKAGQRWLGLFEQARAIVKWSVCRFHAAARSGWLR